MVTKEERHLKRTWYSANVVQTYMMLSSMTISVAIYLFVLFGHAQKGGLANAQLAGSLETCDAEGDIIPVTSEPNMKCFNCTCQNGVVQCVRQQCSPIEGCFVHEELKNDECCPKCKGCTKDGVYHESGTHWRDSHDPCKMYTCIAGVITGSTLQCHTPCVNPLPPVPGKCCPTCPDCHFDGKLISKAARIRPTEDPCITCSCVSGRLACKRKTCPVLNCPESKVVHGYLECCPQCQGTGSYLNPPSGACLLGATVHKASTRFKLDDCTQCSCDNSTVQCERQGCPALDCGPDERETLAGQCCPRCKTPAGHGATKILPVTSRPPHRGSLDVEDFDDEYEDEDAAGDDLDAFAEKDRCVYANKTYANEESWNTSSCETCICIQGRINCTAIKCPALKCPAHSVIKVPGTCCPVCEENYGVCTVFKGSHFRTFDGKVFAFLGSCKYQLASDCDDASFHMRLRTTATQEGGDAQIKRLSLRLGASTRVDLQQNRHTKVNDEIVELPYRLDGELAIEEGDGEVTVTSSTGLRVQWSYVGFLEVRLPGSYRRKVCGLCGNFNGAAEDDMTTREGILVDEAAILAQSWVAGGEECLDTRKYGIRGCNPAKDQRLCSYIKGAVFEKCLRKLNVTTYYETCLRDMCQCPPEDMLCHCESFASYVRDCEMLGILLPRWRKSVGC